MVAYINSFCNKAVVYLCSYIMFLNINMVIFFIKSNKKNIKISYYKLNIPLKF